MIGSDVTQICTPPDGITAIQQMMEECQLFFQCGTQGPLVVWH